MTRFLNNVKTAGLLGLMFGLILAVGSYWGYIGVTIAFIFGGLGNIIAFFYSDKIAVTAMRGQEVNESNAPDLVRMVQRLAQNANIPQPRIYICPQQAPNAFATGRSPNRAAVAVTQGALRLLNPQELEGVIAHELAHIKNRDTLISTIAATIAGALQMIGWLFLFIPIGGDDEGGGNILVALAMIILAPIAAGLIHMAISRSREYVADADGARIAGSPDGLINALQKLDATNKQVPMQHENTAQNHMFIVQPLSAGQTMAKLFSTHPPVEDRIAKLREQG